MKMYQSTWNHTLFSILLLLAAQFVTSETKTSKTKLYDIQQRWPGSIRLRLLSLNCNSTSKPPQDATPSRTCAARMSGILKLIPTAATTCEGDSNSAAAIMVNGDDISHNQDGFNIVVLRYDTGITTIVTNTVINSSSSLSSVTSNIPDDTIVLISYKQPQTPMNLVNFNDQLAILGGGQKQLQHNMVYTLIGYRTKTNKFPDWVNEDLILGNGTRPYVIDTGTKILLDDAEKTVSPTLQSTTKNGSKAAFSESPSTEYIRTSHSKGTVPVGHHKTTPGGKILVTNHTKWYTEEYVVFILAGVLGLSIIVHIIVLVALICCYRKNKLLIYKRSKLDVQPLGKYASYTSLTRYVMDGGDAKANSLRSRTYSNMKSKPSDMDYAMNTPYEQVMHRSNRNGLRTSRPDISGGDRTSQNLNRNSLLVQKPSISEDVNI